ncbi:MAG: hypothetical protein ABSG93_06175 [Solirubrobacteraceae bacterium]|jgi:hypothetical protein
MTHLPELRNSLVDAADREHAAAHRAHAVAGPFERARKIKPARWQRSAHYGRAILASVVLGLTGTAVGAIHVGAPLGPEQPQSPSLARPATVPGSAAQRP